MSYFPMQAMFARTNDRNISFPANTTVVLDMDTLIKGASIYDGSNYYAAPQGATFITCTDLLLDGPSASSTLFQTHIQGANIDVGYSRQAPPEAASSLASDDVSWGDGASLRPVGVGLSLTNATAYLGDLMMFGLVLS
jgi:hypothetical protein